MVKQDLVAAFKKEQFSKKFEELRIKDLVREWAIKINAYMIIMCIYDQFHDLIERKDRAYKEFTSKAMIVRNAKRFFSNRPGQWGKTIEQRT